MTKERQKETGYPHIDRNWMKYYDEELANQKLPQETIYQYMKRNVEKYLDNVLITYNGKTENGYQFLDNINSAAGVLKSIGVDKGKRVMYLMPNIPETAHTLYADSKLGAISDYVDPRPDSINPKVSSQKLLKMILNEKIDYIVVFESCYLSMINPIVNELKELGIEPIVVVSPDDLLTSSQQLYYVKESIQFYGLKKTLKKLHFMKDLTNRTNEAIKCAPIEIVRYGDLLKDTKYVTTSEQPFEPNSLAAITHSSGTTSSFPKTIPIKNEGVNSYAFQLIRSNVNTGIGDSSLHILPYFAAYGLGISHMGFSNADNMIQVPEFSPSCMSKMIMKYKPNVLMGTPNWYLALPKDKVLNGKDLSFIKVIGYGGDSMNPYDEISVNNFLKEHNCKVLITKGHGMSETSGGASYATGDYNLPGSMGIPMIDTIYAVVDPETKELLRFTDGVDKLTGEYIISSPAVVDGKIDGRDVVKHATYDGIDFIYTKDIGTMDKNGVLSFLSRDDRGFTRFDGFKVKPYEIEKQILNLPFVKDCIISSYEDESKFGKMIRADIILQEDFDLLQATKAQIVQNIIEQAFIYNNNVSTRQIPTKYVFRKEYPMTLMNKVDYRAIEKEPFDGTEITVEIDETNVSVSAINVIDSNNKKYVKKI